MTCDEMKAVKQKAQKQSSAFEQRAFESSKAQPVRNGGKLKPPCGKMMAILAEERKKKGPVLSPPPTPESVASAQSSPRDDLQLQNDDEWHDTRWEQASLTHLPGVRQYLTAESEATTREKARLNLLAELGPQNVQEAWDYFKYWVKGAPTQR